MNKHVYRECILVSGTENVHEVKLHGTPWNDCDGEQNFRLENIIELLLNSKYNCLSNKLHNWHFSSFYDKLLFES